MRTIYLVAAALLAASTGVSAQTAGTSPPAASASAPAPAPAPAMVNGEVRKVDLQAGKLTLRHGPIPSMDMPPMTMVFRVAEPKLLEGLKPGDKVRFTADRVDGAMTVTSIETARP